MFPEIPAGSIGWRMGDGESYYNEFYRWFSALSQEEREEYQENNPAPAGWERIYQTISEHPWH
jgi:hypothetical protein